MSGVWRVQSGARIEVRLDNLKGHATATSRVSVITRNADKPEDSAFLARLFTDFVSFDGKTKHNRVWVWEYNDGLIGQGALDEARAAYTKRKRAEQ